jgi:hypothetical protein
MAITLLLLAIPTPFCIAICHLLMTPKSASKYSIVNFIRCFIGQAAFLTFVGYGSPGIFEIIVPWWLAFAFGWSKAIFYTKLTAICFALFAIISFVYVTKFHATQQAEND